MGNFGSCGRCGGMNTTSQKCPECGRSPFKVERSTIADIPFDAIPKYYRNKKWDKSVFWKFHDRDKNDKSISTFVNQSDKVHKIFEGGELPQKSAIFTAPAGFGKMTWCYSCMQLALKFGYSVAPILDTADLKRFLILSSEKVFNVQDLSYDDYLNSDIIFVTVTKTEQRKNSASILVELLDKRARLGKPTIIVSRYSIYELSYWDKSNDFLQIKSEFGDGDPLKVPAIISSF